MAGYVQALTGFANTLGRFTQAWAAYYPPVLGQQIEPATTKQAENETVVSKVFRGTTHKRLQQEQDARSLPSSLVPISGYYSDYLEGVAVSALNEHHNFPKGEDDRPVVVEHAILRCDCSHLYTVHTKVWGINDAFIKSLKYGGGIDRYVLPEKSIKEALQVSWRAMKG
ncbi:MAG: hypothetical protein K2P51_01670 [Rhabdochlamydiaceae bacterium]|nr:hypothetical protein [Rhabdochlamydiaceae bacterium]